MTSFFLKPSPVYFTEILKDSAKKMSSYQKLKRVFLQETFVWRDCPFHSFVCSWVH